MKSLLQSVAPILGAIFVFGGISLGTAADDVLISQFNDASSISRWRFDFGGVTNLIEFDATQDADGDVASGSLRVAYGFDAATLHPSGNNKGAVTIDLPVALDGSTYLTMEMDVRIEPGSATDSAGNSGYLQMVIRNTDGYVWNPQFGGNVSTNGGWRHIAATASGARERIRAITIELFGGAGLTGPVVFHIDNLKFTRPTQARDIFVTQFNDATATNDWRFDYGPVSNLIEFDSSQDASNNPASGSMKVTLGFDGTLAGENKGGLTLDLANPIDASTHLSLEMDVKIAPGSAIDASGNSGYFQLVVRYGGFYDWNPQFGGNLRISDGWRRIRVSPPVPPVEDIHAFTIELFGGAGLTGPVTFNIDNLKFTTTNVVPPSPLMAVDRPIRGLNLIPASGQYERQNIAATNTPGLGWLGSPDPVAYALTIQKYPGASHSGFQTHLFLVPGAPGDSAPDYSQPHLVFLDIQAQGNGTVFAALRYKTNEANGNNFLYTAAPVGGTLGGVSSSTGIGTWSVTFSEDTNAVVRTPDGTTGNFALPPGAAALFAGPMSVFVGAQANGGGNLGQTVILNSFQISKGGSVVFEDNFLTDTELDLQKWVVIAGTPYGVQLIGPDVAFWLSWTIPDSGFFLQTSDLPSWINTGWTASLFGPLKRVLVYHYTDNPVPGRIYVPSPSHGFFRLFRP